ncbi:MAG: type III pantothenate kinase [Anaerolineae bacterium]|nr:MAG: type III pantothenate kinase [Anaerolineae bacterium]
MLLAVDIGNTNIHFGLWDGTMWRVTWRARTVANKMGDEYAVLLRNFLHSAELDFQDVQHVVIASVVPVLTDAFRELVPRYFQADLLNINHTINTGVKIDIDLPEQVGADRIVNAAAVKMLYGGGPAIVIDFGTATTFDVISREGAYIGGAISPGINVALDALVSRTARLYKVDLFPPPSAIGRNTSHALQSGVFLGYVSLVEGLARRLKAALQEDPDGVRVIATGGLAPLFNQHTDVIDEIVDSLTLDGMRVIWELNHDGAG